VVATLKNINSTQFPSQITDFWRKWGVENTKKKRKGKNMWVSLPISLASNLYQRSMVKKEKINAGIFSAR